MVEVDVLMSQLDRSAEYVVKSPCLIVTVYPVIGLPLLSGAVQVTITLSGYQIVFGATG